MLSSRMPTAAERQALIFLAAVALLGSGARVVHSARLKRELSAGAQLTTPAEDSTAVGQQIGAVDSARAAGEGSRRRSRGGAGRRRVGRAERVVGSSGATERPILKREQAPRAPPAPIDINRASAAEIERLPRIGPALAQRIVAWREAHGPYHTLDDLRHVRGIGPAITSLLAESVTF